MVPSVFTARLPTARQERDSWVSSLAESLGCRNRSCVALPGPMRGVAHPPNTPTHGSRARARCVRAQRKNGTPRRARAHACPPAGRRVRVPQVRATRERERARVHLCPVFGQFWHASGLAQRAQGVRGGCAGACGRQRVHLAAQQLLPASVASAAPRSDSSVRSAVVSTTVRAACRARARHKALEALRLSVRAMPLTLHGVPPPWAPAFMVDTVGRGFWWRFGA